MKSRSVSYVLWETEILRERCELHKQENNMKQIGDYIIQYMDGLELHTKLRQRKVYQFYKISR